MDKILLITLIVCFAINIVVVLALHLSKRKRGGNADEGTFVRRDRDFERQSQRS